MEGIREWAIFMLTPQGEILFWNAGAVRIYGYQPEEVSGKHFQILYLPNDQRAKKPEGELQVAAKAGRFEGTGWRTRKDGSKCWTHAAILRVLDGEGHLAGFGVINEDLTQHREKELRYRMLVEGVTDYAIFFLDPTGIVTSWNSGAERIKGYKGEEIIGQHFSKFYTPEDVARGLPDRVLQMAADQGHYEAEGWRVRKDGSRFWCNATMTPLRDEEGRLIGFSKITRDMTERKKLLDRIQQHAQELEVRVRERDRTNAELEAFSYSVSHDLKAPVRAVEGFASALKEEAWEKLNEDERDYLRQITTAAERMSTLIQDLLEYSRLGRAPLDLSPVGVQESVREALIDVPDGVKIHIAVHPSLEVLAHPPTLVQAIANLAGNAVKFRKRRDVEEPFVDVEEPFVKVDAVRHGRTVRISVTDNGIGIAPEHRERIFEVFQRLHTVEEYPGTGIGLALVKRGIIRMGGKIGLESEIGKGSTFWIELPAP
jgi:PAS domain S-box-containing protein